jgi:lipopolysaccharide/colanic/teichoic acid biosynthesis glycosyltransferase
MSESQPVPSPLVSMPTSHNGSSGFYIHATSPVTDPGGDDENDRPAPRETRRAGYFRIKSAVDRLITAILTVIALPVMLLVAAAILLLDGRPVFYRQIRMGKHGREFWIWKFRTMRPDAESSTGAVWSSTSDPRITPLGRWLRCSHLDELPQFFNILAGDMNLVGPRPERPEFVNELARELPDYTQRTVVRPGITGLAQLRLGYDHSVSDVQKKVKLDLQYIRSASFSQDVRLLAHTLPYVVKQLLRKWSANQQWVTQSCAADSANPPEEELVTPKGRRDSVKDQVIAAPHFRLGGPDNVDSGDTSTSAAPIVAFFGHAEDQCA